MTTVGKLDSEVWYHNLNAFDTGQEKWLSTMSATHLRFPDKFPSPVYATNNGNLIGKDYEALSTALAALFEGEGTVKGNVDWVTEEENDEGLMVKSPSIDRYWVNAKGYLEFTCALQKDGSYYCRFELGSFDKEIRAQADAVWCKHVEDINATRNWVYILGTSPSGLRFTSLGMGGEALNRSNYTPEVLAGFDRIKDDLVTKKPRGRLSILSGPPGTGKTYLVRGLVASAEAYFIIVPQQTLPGLVAPGGIDALIKFQSDNGSSRPMVLLLEDADDALANRENSDMSIISTLLNLGDGIMGSCLNLRILATTNRDKQNFDPAVLRPGRLSTSVEVGKLPIEQAQDIFKKLTGNDAVFTEPASIAEIYQKAYDENWSPVAVKPTSRKMGFGA